MASTSGDALDDRITAFLTEMRTNMSGKKKSKKTKLSDENDAEEQNTSKAYEEQLVDESMLPTPIKLDFAEEHESSDEETNPFMFKSESGEESLQEDFGDSGPDDGSDDEGNHSESETVDGKRNGTTSSETNEQKKTDNKELSPEKTLKKKKQKKKQNKDGKKVLKEDDIRKPMSKDEEKLMSLVFGGRTEVVSKLKQEEETGAHSKKPTAGKRSALWHDSDDDDDDTTDMKRNKYNRLELPRKVTNKNRRMQFEQIVGKPRWADLDRVKEPDSDEEMLQKVGHVVKGSASLGIPKGMIELKKLKDLNRETKVEGEITSISFHPTSMVAIITGKRGLVSIVAVDGVRNEKLHSIWLPKIRIVCSRLSPDGNEVIFGSYRKFYHVYNLISGQGDTIKIPVNDSWLMRNFRFSACGKYLASAGDSGEVHLMSAKSKELLRTIQLRQTCQSLAFTPDSRYLLCHTNDTEVFVYGLNEKRIVNVFHDEGCLNGSCIAVCPGGQFVATGSRQGIVNIYAFEQVLASKNPVPAKTISNLTTYIDSLAFNATSELLVIASSTVKNAVKLFHINSGTVFRNFPVHMSNLGHVTAAEFSPSGGFLAIGNKESAVSLFRVKHYANY